MKNLYFLLRWDEMCKYPTERKSQAARKSPNTFRNKRMYTYAIHSRAHFYYKNEKSLHKIFMQLTLFWRRVGLGLKLINLQ